MSVAAVHTITNVSSIMHQVPLRVLPIEVLAQVGPLLRGAEAVVAGTIQLSDNLDRYVVAGLHKGEVVCVRVTRNRWGVTGRSVQRAAGEAAVFEMLEREGILPRSVPREAVARQRVGGCTGQLTN
jgi:hypothetical protein